jgi:hypothetical protein
MCGSSEIAASNLVSGLVAPNNYTVSSGTQRSESTTFSCCAVTVGHINLVSSFLTQSLSSRHPNMDGLVFP